MKVVWWLTGATFLLYLLTLTPGLPPIDVGEFVGCAITYGIPHPTGYPIYITIARLFAMLPISTVTALSLLSALSATFALFFLAKSAMEESTGDWGWLIILLFPVSTIVWDVAIRPEVYAFNSFLLAGAFWAAQGVWRGEKRAVIFLGLFSGFATVTHLSSGYFLLPLWLGLLMKPESRKLILHPLPWLVGAIPLTAHLILPIRSAFGLPPYTWGDMHTFDGWWRHVSGWQYRVWLFQSSDDWAKNIGDFFHDWLPRMAIFAAAGLFFLLKYDWKRAIWIFAILAFPVVMVSGYRIADLDTYYLPAYLISAWLGAYAVSSLPLHRIKSKWIIPTAIGVVVILFGVWQYPRDSRIEDKHQMVYTRALLATLPSPAVLFSADWEIVVGPMQAYLAQGERPDLSVVDLELMRRSWYIELLLRKYPYVCAGCENELNELIPALRKFERNEDIAPETLETLYRRAIYVLMLKNSQRAAVCITFDVEIPKKIPLYPVALPLFTRLQSEDVNYIADPNGLQIDPLYENPVDTRIDNRIREKVAESLLERANYLFHHNYREEAFTFVKLARNAKPNDDSPFWKMLMLLEQEEGKLN